MQNKLNVFKFGGASLKDAVAIAHVGTILRKFAGQPLVIVVSAMGKTTNALEEVASAYWNGNPDEARSKLKELHEQTSTIINALFTTVPEPLLASVNDLFVSVEWALEEPTHAEYDFDYDQIVSLGELLSSHIVTAHLNDVGLPTTWLDARDIIQTDNTYREGWVKWPETVERAQARIPPLLEQTDFVLTQGFHRQHERKLHDYVGSRGLRLLRRHL